MAESTAYFMGNLHSVESKADIIALDQENYIAFFDIGINDRVAYFNNFSSDLFAMLNAEHHLIDYNQQFFDKFYRLMEGSLNYRGKYIGAFFRKNDWELFKRNQTDKKEYLEECIRNSNGPWTPAYAEDFRDNTHEQWEFDPTGKWTTDGDELHGETKQGFSFCLLKRAVDVSAQDVRIEFSVKCRNEFKFGCFIAGRHEHYTFSPDSSGYYLGVGPEGMVVKRCGMKMIEKPQQALQADCWHKVILEKTGGKVTLDIDPQSRVEFLDLQPIADPSLNACGLACGANTSFKDFKVSNRISTLRIGSHSAFERFDMHLEDFPEEIYEISLYPGSYNQKPVEIMHLRNITRLRMAQEELKNKNREHKRLLTKHQELQRRLDSEADAIMIGSGSIMEKIRSIIQNTADTQASILITGETGTGKDLVARQLHLQSKRGNEPFVKVDCASLPPLLLESELFGYEKGAFTGAADRKTGRFEAAGRGTIFLDEISNLELSLQTKLLRVLQDRKFERIGSNITLTTEARIISASNQNLDLLIETNRFRKDLYFRINTIIINTPPLRERIGDIPELTLFFIKEYCEKHPQSIPEITPQAMRLLCRYPWPGNIRELRNAVIFSLLLGNKRFIDVHDLPDTIRQCNTHTGIPKKSGSGPRIEPRDLSAGQVKEALNKAQGNITLAAADLNIGRQSIYRLMEKHGYLNKNRGHKKALTLRQETLLTFIQENVNVDINKLITQFSVSRKSIQRDLQCMLDKKMILRQRTGTTVEYVRPASA
ncbi:MAG: sigma-54 dependent transcriptional regulator [Fibrobacterota bacterium]